MTEKIQQLLDFCNQRIKEEESREIHSFMNNEEVYMLQEYINGYVRAMQDILYYIKEE